MNEMDIENIDPNDFIKISLNRDEKWFCNTWTSYIKPKLKVECKKWNTLTGGGSGEPSKFGNFCGSDRWLVWIYFMDIQCDYLLFGNAKGTPPSSYWKRIRF